MHNPPACIYHHLGFAGSVKSNITTLCGFAPPSLSKSFAKSIYLLKFKLPSLLISHRGRVFACWTAVLGFKSEFEITKSELIMMFIAGSRQRPWGLNYAAVVSPVLVRVARSMRYSAMML
jgi:hypothetical protein